MVEVSSEAGYLNIGSAKISSYPKIEPEIEAIEAIGDSNEVCGLEKKECVDIMEHLKNNPGLVVKSLGLEGQMALHVAVTTGETKIPKPPASKCTDKGFSPAADDSDWYRALERPDCKALMSLLQANPCLVAQTGPKGKTVLHVAAAMGCLELLGQILDLFKDKHQFMDEMSGVRVDWFDLVQAKYGTFEAEVDEIAYFTCPRDVWKCLSVMSEGEDFMGIHINGVTYDFQELSRALRLGSDAPHHLKDKIIEIMEREPSKKAFESLEEDYQQHLDYNFVLERKELQFHYACGAMWYNPAANDYVKTIIDGCLELGSSESVEVLTYLFQLHNAQGEIPFHLACDHGFSYISRFLEVVPPDNAYKECLNAKDARGWTMLHYAVAIKNHEDLEALLKDERTDVNAEATHYNLWSDSIEFGMTALHLAILHNDVNSVKLLLQCTRTNVNTLFYRDILYGYEKIKSGDDEDNQKRGPYWSPLELAAIMGLSDVVRALLGSSTDGSLTDGSSKVRDIYNDGKLPTYSVGNKRFQGVSPLFFASASGNPSTLRLFLDYPKMFDPLVKSEGATALHYATNAMMPTTNSLRWNIENRTDKVGRFLNFWDLKNTDLLKPRRYEKELEDTKLTPTSYLGRQACITMLLQAGIDIWEKDNYNRLADPGPQAPEEAHLWWHEKMARETLEAKMSLNNAANAISVVAALVATASFVGPLQPPLGYGGDSMEGGIQDTHLSVRVFMVSNILSFYLAVASIMFAVVPSLPMPQEGIYVEYQRTRRTVGLAIFFLLLSVLGVLISFGAASNSVVSEDYSWQHVGLSFYPTLLGGFICIFSISLFFLRLLRLVFTRNAKVRYLYKSFVKF